MFVLARRPREWFAGSTASPFALYLQPLIPTLFSKGWSIEQTISGSSGVPLDNRPRRLFNPESRKNSFVNIKTGIVRAFSHWHSSCTFRSAVSFS